MGAAAGLSPRSRSRTQQLAPGLYMLMGSGGNMALSHGPRRRGPRRYRVRTAEREKFLAAVKAAGGGGVKYVRQHALARRPHGRQRAARQSPARRSSAHGQRARWRMSSEQFMAAFNNKIPPLARGRTADGYLFPHARRSIGTATTVNVIHVEPGAHRRRFDRALHERERDSHRRHVS